MPQPAAVPLESLYAAPGPPVVAFRTILPLLPAFMELHTVGFKVTNAGDTEPGRLVREDRATLCTLMVAVPTAPPKKRGCGSVTLMPTRWQSVPSVVALSVCDAPPPTALARMSALVSGTGLVNVTVVVPMLNVATRAAVPVAHV